MIYEKNITACFTGHRPTKLGGYDENNPIAIDVKSKLQKIINKAKEKGYKYFISGMALGIDQWAAEIILKDNDLKLIAAIPYQQQYINWPEEAQDKYFNLLKKVDYIHIISDTYKYQPNVMQKRNMWMVDNSSLVISIWDDSKSGTKNCVDYALQNNVKVIRYNPKTKHFGEIKRQ